MRQQASGVRRQEEGRMEEGVKGRMAERKNLHRGNPEEAQSCTENDKETKRLRNVSQSLSHSVS
jgi:hypothetical protein